jgi:hypothetical protein
MATMAKKKLLIQVKENQKELQQNCRDIIRFSEPEYVFRETEKGRNRVENRDVSVYGNEK